jgi:citrate lyase subunit beta / citryl-CoA lyase
MTTNRPLRSVLFVPGSKPRMLEKARTLPADAVILDLEDAVAPGEKAGARGTIRAALESGDYTPQVVVRVNAFATKLTEDDLRGTLVSGVSAVCLPKAEATEDVTRLAALLDVLERERALGLGSVGILVMIETARAVLEAYDIARASDRVWALCLGGEDLSHDLGAVRTAEGIELAYARAHLVTAARAAGVLAMDTVYTDLANAPGFEAEARSARTLGYSGKLLVHPAQVEPVHRAFAPTEAETHYARRLVEAFELATIRGDGVISFEGKMIDAPVVARAREVLARASGGVQ